MSGSATAEASARSRDNLTTAARVFGVVRRPRSTFEAVVRAPRSAALLALLFLVPFVASAVLFSTAVGRQALVDQWETTALAFGQEVDDERYAEFRRLSERAVPYAAVTALTGGPVAAAALALVVYGWFTAVRRGSASYRQVLAVVATASVILMVRWLIAAPVSYIRETTASAVTLGQIFAMDPASPSARFLSLIDVFVVWWLVVLAVGVSVLYGRRIGRTAALFVGVYVAMAVGLAGVMAVLGGT